MSEQNKPLAGPTAAVARSRSARRLQASLRCDECGRFVAFADIDAGIARHQLVSPDSY